MRAVKVGRIEYRIRCASFGSECHTNCAHAMKDRVAAEEAVTRYDAARTRPRCAPWVIEARSISEWGDPDAAELCLYAVGRTLRGQLDLAAPDLPEGTQTQ